MKKVFEFSFPEQKSIASSFRQINYHSFIICLKYSTIKMLNDFKIQKKLYLFIFMKKNDDFCFRAFQNLQSRRRQLRTHHASKVKLQSSLRSLIAQKRMRVNPRPRQKRRKMDDPSQLQDHNSNDRLASTGLDLAATFCHFPKARALLVRKILPQTLQKN